MPSLLTLFFTYFSEAIIVFFYYQSIYTPKKGKLFSFSITFLCYMILMLIFRYICNYEFVNVILILLTNIILMTVVFYSSIKSAIFHGVMLIIIQYITELITAYLMATTLNKSSKESVAQYFAVGSIISKMLYFFLSRFLSKISLKEKNSRSWGRWALLSILPISSVFVLLYIRSLNADKVLSSAENLMNVLTTFFLLVSNIIVYMIYEKAEKSNQRLVKLELINQKNEIDMQYLKLLEKKNKDMRILMHDYKNHIVTIGAMSDNNRVMDYVESMLGDIREICQTGKTKNRILDIIISKYAGVCHTRKIEFVTDVMSDNLAFISDKDISSLFNNILDNAVEASKESKKKYILFETSVALNSFHRITIKNSCDKSPRFTQGKLITMKKNKDAHGFGTKSIEKIVKKYNGELEWKWTKENREFVLSIIIPMEQ